MDSEYDTYNHCKTYAGFVVVIALV